MPELLSTDVRLQQEPEIFAGPYVEGEIPEPIVVQFFQNDGVTVINLTGYTVNLVIKDKTKADAQGTTLVGDLADAANGKARYTWVDGDLDTPAEYVATMWVGNGTVRLASKLIEFTVYTSEVTIPSI